MNSRKRWLIRICSIIVISNNICYFDLLHRFWQSPSCQTVMVCMDLALCLFSSVDNKIKCENANNLRLGLSSPFLKETELSFILLGSIWVGISHRFITHLVEKREYASNKYGLKIFVHCFGMY